MRDLLTVLGDLYDSEINASVSSLWDGGFTVRLGDELNGFKAGRTFDRGDHGRAGAFVTWPELWAAAAAWLHEEALRRYPDSTYAELIR